MTIAMTELTLFVLFEKYLKALAKNIFKKIIRLKTVFETRI
jgi:hypothetical protein